MKTLNKLMGIVILILFILNINFYFKLNNLNQLYQSNLNQVSGLSNQINNLENNVINNLSSFQEKQKWVTEANYSTVKEDANYKNAIVEIHGSIRELEKDAKIYIEYGTVELGKSDVKLWNKVPVQLNEALKFKKELTLSYKNNYKFIIVSESNLRTRSEDLLEIDLSAELDNHIMFGPTFARVDRKSIFCDINIQNDFRGKDILKIKDIYLMYLINGKLDKTVEIYKNGKIVDLIGLQQAVIVDNGNQPVKNNSSNGVNDIEKFNYSYQMNADYYNKNISVRVVAKDFTGREVKSIEDKIYYQK